MDELETLEFMEVCDGGRERKRLRQETRELNDPFSMEDGEFIKEFRLSIDLAQDLCEELTPYLPKPTKSSDLSVETRVLTALNFYAHGSYQKPVGKHSSLSVAQQTVSAVLAQVTAALNAPEMRRKYIAFPTLLEERNHTRVRFYQEFGMPGVIGCIDGTHVSIVRPKENEERYFNRKHYHSLNVQLICDANMSISSVDASYGGATHDSFIWSGHPLNPYLERLSDSEGLWLLGDSGYPLRRTMMTPILNAAPGSPEAHYTDMHVKTRNLVERTIGTLKARFRCTLVHRTLHYEPQVAGRIVNACVILHNICNNANIPYEELSVEEASAEASMQPTTVIYNEPAATSLGLGQATRRNLVARLWSERR